MMQGFLRTVDIGFIENVHRPLLMTGFDKLVLKKISVMPKLDFNGAPRLSGPPSALLA